MPHIESKNSDAELFPLPLAPFEFYYLQDDRSDYPTAFPAVLRFAGKLDRQAFTHAMQLVVARHPLLTAIIDRPPNVWPSWTPGPTFTLDWRIEDRDSTVDGWLLPLEKKPIDLCREPGFRAAVYELLDATELRMEIHHACCDGISAQMIVRDLLLAYDHLAQRRPGEPALPPVDPTRLRLRDEFGMADYRPTLRDVWNMAVLWGAWLLRPAAVVAATGRTIAGQRSTEQRFSYATTTMTTEETARLSARAKALGATVNDVVLRDCFQTFDDWNRSASKRPRGILRILVPTNLRLEEDLVMPAANVLGFAFLSRRRRAVADSTKLLQGIHEEMAAIKKWRLGLYFVAGVRIACRWPKLLRWSLHRDHAFATAVFSNMAVVFHNLGLPQRDGRAVVGGSELTWMASVPPIRPGTRAALAAVTYAGSLHLHLRGDARWLDDGAVRQIADSLVARLRRSDAEGPGSSASAS